MLKIENISIADLQTKRKVIDAFQNQTFHQIGSKKPQKQRLSVITQI